MALLDLERGRRLLYSVWTMLPTQHALKLWLGIDKVIQVVTNRRRRPTKKKASNSIVLIVCSRSSPRDWSRPSLSRFLLAKKVEATLVLNNTK
mmetsp:Transcript_27449/g.59601  ORF Transcript_27449/g.59601 Transcript_27449/m.59601 type:complete len:93 (+) Transcript_27449:340-618(+)